MDVTVLGTASPYPRSEDPCSSFLLKNGDTSIWLDAGSGSLGALLSHTLLDNLDAVWISHTHADHFADLTVTYYALAFADISRPPLPVYGPPGWAERLRDFLSHNGPSPIEKAFDVYEVFDGYQTTIGSMHLTAHQMHHDAPCYGLRASAANRVVGFTGDTAPCPGLDQVAAGADLLICEAGYGDSPVPLEPEPVHLTATEAGAATAAGDVGHLLLTHLAGADVDDCVVAARLAGATHVSAARPGDVVTVS